MSPEQCPGQSPNQDPEQTQIDFHIHAVLDMLATEDRSFSVAELHQVILDKFGATARFSSCSSDGMDANEAIEFLFARQKLIESSSGQYKLNSGNSCGH